LFSAIQKGFVWNETTTALPRSRRERPSKRTSLAREISSISDSELSDPTVMGIQTRTRGVSVSGRVSFEVIFQELLLIGEKE